MMAKARTWILGAGCLLVVFGVVIFGLLVRGLSTPSLPREMVLSLRLAGPIAEVTADDPLAEMMGEEATSLRKVREALVRAAEDDRVVGLRLRVDSIGGGFATAQELRSLIARVNAAGKWIIGRDLGNGPRQPQRKHDLAWKGGCRQPPHQERKNHHPKNHQ
jgi:hypothetical protein